VDQQIYQRPVQLLKPLFLAIVFASFPLLPGTPGAAARKKVMTQSTAPTSYKLKQIRVTRTYDFREPEYGKGAIQAGEKIYDATERDFEMGWDFTFKSGMEEFDNKGISHGLAQVSLQVPEVIQYSPAAETKVSFLTRMTAEWELLGYAVDQDHTIRLWGSAGEKEWSVRDKASGSYSASIESANTLVLTTPEGKELSYPINAQISFGEEIRGNMLMLLIYEKRP
jgi:hypothetical protein